MKFVFISMPMRNDAMRINIRLLAVSPPIILVLCWLYERLNVPFCRIVCCSTAVSSVYGSRRTMGVTVVNSAADNRRTITL
ncbi:MAG: hypothetical protein HXL32_05010 [Prevotellaceae bacterium]|nr:hypothetical protein [Prevotellaceae bacterium]